MQNIVLYEYLPAFLGEALPKYTGYEQNVHPGITHVFQSAAFRFGHSLIPPGLYRRDSKCNFKKTPMGHLALRLCSTWWDSNVSKMSSAYFIFIIFIALYPISEWRLNYIGDNRHPCLTPPRIFTSSVFFTISS